MRNGDVILQVGGRPVADPAELSAALEQALKKRPADAIDLVVLRGAETRMLYLEPYWLTEPQ
ncbi:MAG: hypothetical protein QN114_10520 [Armatimonadota bacterium]|nr:hypothetical protein [Armatimonadota bacterium]